MSKPTAAPRLLFDQNLPVRLVHRLSDLFPNASHVSLAGLDRASDVAVWEHAHDNGYTIVTKDSDFNAMSLLRGFPPKVIWLRLGNCTTDDIERVLRSGHAQIVAFATNDSVGILELVQPASKTCGPALDPRAEARRP